MHYTVKHLPALFAQLLMTVLGGLGCFAFASFILLAYFGVPVEERMPALAAFLITFVLSVGAMWSVAHALELGDSIRDVLQDAQAAQDEQDALEAYR